MGRIGAPPPPRRTSPSAARPGPGRKRERRPNRLTAGRGIRRSGLPRRRSPRRRERNRPGMKRAAPISAANEPGSRGPGLLAGSLKQQWKRYRKQLKRCQHECSPRAIHAFRVETRRLVSTLELLDGFLPSRQMEKAQRILKHHRDAFDELRDTQVQLAAVGGMRRAFPALSPFYACLREREERLTRKTCKRLT